MQVKDQIETKLREEFAPITLDVRDVSASHAGHSGARPGGQTHFEVDITSDAFTGMSRVQSHRKIHASLRQFLDGPVHALQLNVRSK